MHTPSPELLKEVRAELVMRGTSLNAFCTEHGFVRQAVSVALSGQRNGRRAAALRENFMNAVRDAYD